MTYPTLAPASRSFTPGDYPIKTYQSQSGVETRILYGSKRTNMTLELSYDNITDTQAQEFLTHYIDTQGTFIAFNVPAAIRTGWTGASNAFDPGSTGALYRYAQAPQVTAVRPGVSTVQVELVGVV